MVSPRIKTLPSASPSPTTETSKRHILSSRRGDGGDSPTGKGNYSGYVDRMRLHTPDTRDLKGFRDSGFMDEATMARRDKDALDDSVTNLQSQELFVVDSPRIKSLPSASPSPTMETSKYRVVSSRRRDGGENATEKGNYSGCVDKVRSPLPTLFPGHFVSEMLEDCTPDMSDVMGFRDARFMDEATMVRKEKEALEESVTKLRSKELFAMDSPRIRSLPSAPPSPTMETSKHRVLSSRRRDGGENATEKGNYSDYVDKMRSPLPTPFPAHFVSEMLEDCTPDMRDMMGFRGARFMDEATMVRKDKEALEESVTKLRSEELFGVDSPRIKSLPSASPSPTTETSKHRVLSSRRRDGCENATEKGNYSGYVDKIRSPLSTPFPVHFSPEMLEDSTPDMRDVMGFRDAGFMDEATMVRKDTEALEESVTKLQSKLERDLHKLSSENSSLSKGTLEEKDACDFLDHQDFDDIDKLCSSDAMISEANRMNSDFMQLPEMENRKSLPKMEEDHDAMIIKEREYIQEWEKKLQERELKLSEGLQNLNEMEEKAMKFQTSLDEREQLCKKTSEEIDSERMDLKKKENDVNHKLAEISVKEQEIENLKKSLDKREKDLITFEENINLREKVGIEAVLEEYRHLQEKKKMESEMEMEKTKASVEKECREMRDSAERKEAELNHLEKELLKRQDSLDAESERLREKDESVEQVLHSVEEKKRRLEVEEKALEVVKTDLDSEKETLLCLQLQLESQQAVAADMVVTLQREQLLLTVTTKERSDQSLLLEDLKQEFVKLMLEKREISNEIERMGVEKEKLEKEMAAVGEEVRASAEESKRLERLILSEKERADQAKQIKEQLELENAELISSKNLMLEKREISSEIERMRAEKEKLEKEMAAVGEKVKASAKESKRLERLILSEKERADKHIKERLELENAELISSKNLMLEKREISSEIERMRVEKEKLEKKMAAVGEELRASAKESKRLERLILSEKERADQAKQIKEQLELENAELISRKKLLEKEVELRILSGASEPRTMSVLHGCTSSALDPDPERPSGAGEVPEASVGEEEAGRKTRSKRKNTVVVAREKRSRKGAAQGEQEKAVSGNRKRGRDSSEGGEGSSESEVQGVAADWREEKVQAAESTAVENRYSFRREKSGVTTRAQRKKAEI